MCQRGLLVLSGNDSCIGISELRCTNTPKAIGHGRTKSTWSITCNRVLSSRTKIFGKASYSYRPDLNNGGKHKPGSHTTSSQCLMYHLFSVLLDTRPPARAYSMNNDAAKRKRRLKEEYGGISFAKPPCANALDIDDISIKTFLTTATSTPIHPPHQSSCPPYLKPKAKPVMLHAKSCAARAPNAARLQYRA